MRLSLSSKSAFPTPKLASRLLSCLSVVALSAVGTHSAFASEIGVLRVQNDSNATQTFIVIDDYFRCMDFPLPKKEADGTRTTITVPANAYTDTRFARDGSCDPLGRFIIMALDRRTGQPIGNGAAFETDSDAEIKRIWEAESPNGAMVGLTPIGTDYKSGKKTFVLTTTLPGYDFQRPTGKWVIGCGGNQGCETELSSSVENTVSKEETTSKEVMNAFSATVSAGFEFEGISGGAEMTSSSSTTTSEALTLASSGTKGKVATCKTPTDMKEYQVYNVWQWSIEAYVGTGKVSTVTCQTTCTPTGMPPKYLPGAPEAIEACLIKKTDATILAAQNQARTETEGANAKQAAAIAAKASAAKAAAEKEATCATFSSEPYGKGTSVKLCGQDNWNKYTNLGSPGTNNLHGQVKSVLCGSGLGTLQFTNGNAPPFVWHSVSCTDGPWLHPEAFMTTSATGVKLHPNHAK